MVTFKICTFVYLNVEYLQQEHFLEEKEMTLNFKKCMGRGQGLEILSCLSAINTWFWASTPWNRPKSSGFRVLTRAPKNLSKILANTWWKKPPRGGFLFTMFPDQEPCKRYHDEMLECDDRIKSITPRGGFESFYWKLIVKLRDSTRRIFAQVWWQNQDGCVGGRPGYL